MKYKIIADSSANVYERAGIDYSCVPLKILTSEKEYSDVKGTDILKEGGDFEKMSEAVTDYCRHSHLLFALKHLDNPARNGRVNPVVPPCAAIMQSKAV